jgi:hypothetical protein
MGAPNPNKPAVRVGEGAVREVAAKLLDAPGAGQVGVPDTLLVEVTRGAQTKYFLYGAPKNHDHYGLSRFCMDKR